MRLIYTFKAIPDRPLKSVDLALFCLSTMICKQARYDVVLYCDDLVYKYVIQEYNLSNLFDEINPVLPRTKNNSCWAMAKIEAMELEDNDAIFIDPDAFLWKQIDLNSDLIVWQEEQMHEKIPAGVYEYKHIENLAKMFDYKNHFKAYNCGIVYFKDINKRKEYAQRVKQFMDKYSSCNDIRLMLTGEQVNLYEYSKEKDLKTWIMGNDTGFCNQGAHLYCRKIYPYGNTPNKSFENVYVQLMKDLFPEQYKLIKERFEKEMTLSEDEIRNFDYYKVLKRAIEAPR